MAKAHNEPEADEPEDPPVPAEVRERWRARRRGIVMVLRVLCALPALMVLYYAFFPKVNYTHRLTLAAPTAERTVEVGEIRLEPRDRALGLVARGPDGKDRADAPRIVVRNNLRSDEIHHRLVQLARPARYLLTLGPPREAGDVILPLDTWKLEVVTSSDYATQLRHRMVGLFIGLLLVGVAMLAIPRLIHVLWPDK
jgi:hypothetical protein